MQRAPRPYSAASGAGGRVACWQASSGRGKRGQLLFHKTPESLRNEMMEQALNNGQQQTALELAQLAPVELKPCSIPSSAVSGKTIPPRCVFLTIARWSRCVPAFSRPRRAASGRTNLCRADALRRRRQYADRRSGAPLAGLPGRPALAFLYPLHAVLAQWRYGGNRAVATAVTAAA